MVKKRVKVECVKKSKMWLYLLVDELMGTRSQTQSKLCSLFRIQITIEVMYVVCQKY